MEENIIDRSNHRSNHKQRWEATLKSDELLESICDEVKKKLPMNIVPEELTGKPGFQALLKALSEHITKSGLKPEKQFTLEEVQSRVRQQRKSYLRNHILFDCMNEMVTDWDVQRINMEKSNIKQKYRSAYRDALYTSEICSYLTLPGDVKLLGLNEDDVISHLANPAKLQTYTELFSTDLEDYLKCKCERITKFHNSAEEGGKMLTAKATILPVVVENERIKFLEEQKYLMLERARVDKQLTTYYKALERIMLIFEDLLTRLKLTILSEKDRVDCDWLLARSEALILKARIIELQLTAELYTKETVPALDMLNENLDVELQAKEDELKQVELLLGAYESVGPDFDELVTEFTRLRDTLDDKIWAKRELAGNLTGTGSSLK